MALMTTYGPGRHRRRTGRTGVRAPARMPAPAAPIPSGPSVSSEARTALQKAMAQYQPGGGLGVGVEAGLERGRVKALSSGMQHLVSAGLAGTTMAGGLGKKYEEEVAAPARARVEDIRAEKLSSLQLMLAQMEQGGYQAGLGREFQATQAALGRQFQGTQAAQRIRQTTPTPTPISTRQPSAYAKGITPGTQTYPGWMDSSTNIMRAATTAYKQPSEPSWATFNGERYEMGEGGPYKVPSPSMSAEKKYLQLGQTYR